MGVEQAHDCIYFFFYFATKLHAGGLVGILDESSKARTEETSAKGFAFCEGIFSLLVNLTNRQFNFVVHWIKDGTKWDVLQLPPLARSCRQGSKRG